jgi:uncharacterized membrane protein
MASDTGSDNAEVNPSFDPDAEYRVDRLPASIALIACIIGFLLLPNSLVISPKWLMPVLMAIALIPLAIAPRYRRANEYRWVRPLTIGLIALINIANVISVSLLVHRQFWPNSSQHQDVHALFWSGILIWITNVIVFALWYWEIDRGGPARRGTPEQRLPDFQFPQMENPKFAPAGWHPSFYDYAYVSFTNAAAFSPTDAMPLTRLVKGLMTFQSGVAMLTLIVIVGRAINILQ